MPPWRHAAGTLQLAAPARARMYSWGPRASPWAYTEKPIGVTALMGTSDAHRLRGIGPSSPTPRAGPGVLRSSGAAQTRHRARPVVAICCSASAWRRRIPRSPTERRLLRWSNRRWAWRCRAAVGQDCSSSSTICCQRGALVGPQRRSCGGVLQRRSGSG